VAIVLLSIGLVLEGILIGLGRGLPSLADKNTRAMLLGPFGFYIVSCLWGVVIGGPLGVILYLAGRFRAPATGEGPPADNGGGGQFPIPSPASKV
jgi:hypothetical protein